MLFATAVTLPPLPFVPASALIVASGVVLMVSAASVMLPPVPCTDEASMTPETLMTASTACAADLALICTVPPGFTTRPD